MEVTRGPVVDPHEPDRVTPWQATTWTSDAVWGCAARNILAGRLPDGDEHQCCRVARSLHRRCWHQAAAILLANELRQPHD